MKVREMLANLRAGAESRVPDMVGPLKAFFFAQGFFYSGSFLVCHLPWTAEATSDNEFFATADQPDIRGLATA